MKAIQTLIFLKKKYNRAEALSWAKKHGFKHYTSRLTENTVRLRQIPPERIGKVLGTFYIGKDIKAVFIKKNHK